MNGLEIYIFLIIASCLIYYLFVQNRVTDRFESDTNTTTSTSTSRDAPNFEGRNGPDKRWSAVLSDNQNTCWTLLNKSDVKVTELESKLTGSKDNVNMIGKSWANAMMHATNGGGVVLLRDLGLLIEFSKLCGCHMLRQLEQRSYCERERKRWESYRGAGTGNAEPR